MVAIPLKSNIRLLMWDKYFINKQSQEWILGFEKTYGSGNIIRMYADDFDVKFLIENIWGWWLFASRKMIILYDVPLAANRTLPAGNKDQIEKFISYFIDHVDHIDDDSITLVFISPMPDKRTVFFKFLSDPKNHIKTQELKYSEEELIWLVENHIGWLYKDNQKNEIYDFFKKYYKDNLYALENELTKLQNYGNILEVKTIEEICSPDQSYDLFNLIERLLSPEINLEEKNQIIEDIKSNDDNPFAFLGLFSWNIISILNLIDGIKSWRTDYKELMMRVKIHPFTFGKLYKQKKMLLESHDKIINILSKIIKLEYQIKLGIVPQEYFRPGFKEIMR